MNDGSPAIGPLLARLCGGAISDMNYVGYVMNEHGEELVVAQRRGDRNARLWHCDAYWEMARVGDHSIRLAGPMERVITVAGLIINRYEATWLSSCLAASRLCAWDAKTYRSDSGTDLGHTGGSGHDGTKGVRVG